MSHVVLLSTRALPDDLPDLAEVTGWSPDLGDLAERSADVVHAHAVRLAVEMLAAERRCCPQEAWRVLVEAAALLPCAAASDGRGRPIHQQAYRILALGSGDVGTGPHGPGIEQGIQPHSV